jgi:hypothetical protein
MYEVAIPTGEEGVVVLVPLPDIGKHVKFDDEQLYPAEQGGANALGVFREHWGATHFP